MFKSKGAQSAGFRSAAGEITKREEGDHSSLPLGNDGQSRSLSSQVTEGQLDLSQESLQPFPGNKESRMAWIINSARRALSCMLASPFRRKTQFDKWQEQLTLYHQQASFVDLELEREDKLRTELAKRVDALNEQVRKSKGALREDYAEKQAEAEMELAACKNQIGLLRGTKVVIKENIRFLRIQMQQELIQLPTVREEGENRIRAKEHVAAIRRRVARIQEETQDVANEPSMISARAQQIIEQVETDEAVQQEGDPLGRRYSQSVSTKLRAQASLAGEKSESSPFMHPEVGKRVQADPA